MSPVAPSGDQATDEEGVHPGILSRSQVHVGLLHAGQARLSEQDVYQGTGEIVQFKNLFFLSITF